MQEVDAKLQQAQFQHHLGDVEADTFWKRTCSICREVLLQVCGVLEQSKGQLWLLRNRQQDIISLDQAIATARA